MGGAKARGRFDCAETNVVRIRRLVTSAGQVHAVVEDVDGAVEALMHLDADVRLADLLLPSGDVDAQLAEAHCVVIADRTTDLEAEHLVVGR